MNTKMIRAISRDTWETWIRIKIPAKNAVTPYGIKEAISPITTGISGFFSFVINPTFCIDQPEGEKSHQKSYDRYDVNIIFPIKLFQFFLKY